MCNHVNDPGGREAAMVVIAPGVHCDPCLAPIVRALHKSALPTTSTIHGPERIRTVASCCGHGYRPGKITLADGRVLLLMAGEQHEQVEGLWPGINGENAGVGQVTVIGAPDPRTMKPGASPEVPKP